VPYGDKSIAVTRNLGHGRHHCERTAVAVAGPPDGRGRFLDALELEMIIWLPEGHLTQLLDPSADRWRDT